jgi:predicted membrane protein
MIKRLLLIAFFSLNLFVAPTAADEKVAEITTVDQSQDVEIDIPDSLPQGFHSVVVQVTDPDSGDVSDEEVFFCKDTNDELQWDNNCPDLTTAGTPAETLVIEQTVIGGVTVDVVVDPQLLEGITDPEALPNYNPISEPEKVAETQVAGFAALSVLSAGGAAAAAVAGGSSSSGGSSGGGGSDAPGKGGGSNKGIQRPREEDDDSDSEEAAPFTPEDAAKGKRRLVGVFAALGIGDRSITWRAPFTNQTDAGFIAASITVSRFAPLLGKIFNDASYLRAILGSLSLLTIPASIFLGIQALVTTDSQPIPPVWQVFAAIALLTLVDSFAGLVAVLIYALGVFVSGNINSLSAVLTVLTVSAICVSPSIMASSFRPFRRKIGQGHTFWERGVDYLLATVLTAWTISGFINSLNAISGKQLAIIGYATNIGVIVGVGILVRMVLEDIATYLYPNRTAQLAIELPKPSPLQQYISMTCKALIFALIMNTFVGFNLPLLIGTILFIMPNVAKLRVGHLLPKSRMLHFAIPKGGLRIVIMTAFGTLFARFSENLFTDPQIFLTWGFVLLSIPGFILGILTLISDDKDASTLREDKVGKWVYRIVGVYVFYLIVQIAQGKDVIEVILQPFKG